MARKKRSNGRLERFGNFLKQARIAAGIQTQKAAISELAKVGFRISGADMCRYEKGTIYNPSQEAFNGFAAIYQVGYATLVLRFMIEKYGLGEDKCFRFLLETLLRSTKSAVNNQ